MKKKTIILLIILVLLITIGCLLFNNRVASTIILDINPSIKINLDKNENVISVKALNDDAKEIISDEYNNKSLDVVFDLLVTKLIDKDYGIDNKIDIILHAEGKIDTENVGRRVENIFGQKIDTHVIVVNDITPEDKELAKKYDITPSKASYINSILKDNENIELDSLINKPVSDLNETKLTGSYCDDGYQLNDGRCYKEIRRTSASNGLICPEFYYEYEGKCYIEEPINHTDQLFCRDEFELVNNECVRTSTISANPVKYKCPSGEESTYGKAGLAFEDSGIANDIVCLDTSNAKHPVSPCETHDGTEYTVVGGKCYWHRAPVIAAGCPGKILVNGVCWDDASNILICEGYRDGKRYNSRDEYCEHSIKTIEPVVTEYKCPDDYTLNGDKCVKYEKENAEHVLECPSGYARVNNDRCIDYNKVREKESGLVCDEENSRVQGNECIIYEVVDAKHN